MPIIQSEFNPGFPWKNPHLQTVMPAFFRQPNPPPRQHIKMPLRDGDELLIELCKPKQARKDAVLLVHGLTGSADSQYIIGLQNLLLQRGILSIAMNHRGAKQPNNSAKGYHSGSSHDLADIITYIQQRYPEYNWHCIGFSLGGNILLKYLGEHPNNPLHSAVAVSVPFNLDLCSARLNQGFSKVYQAHLLRGFSQYMANKYEHLQKNFPDQAALLSRVPWNKKFKTMWEFDDCIVAPLHGFQSAPDYYAKCSSRQFLKNITKPTHIIHALDDPFMSESIVPDASELSDSVVLELCKYGGHVGFYDGNLFRNQATFFIESLVESFFGDTTLAYV